MPPRPVCHLRSVTLREPDRWNHNTQYHPLVLNALPENARTALDVGTGDGLLALDLHRRVPAVTAIDLDPMVPASAQRTGADVHWVHGDAMTHPLPTHHFDLVASIATIHHLPDLRAALHRLADLTTPGGRVVIIGLARSSRPSDYLADMAGIVQHQVLSRTRGFWQHTAPVQTTLPHTYTEVRRIARTALPDVTWRRLPLWRYALTWVKPTNA